MNLMIGAPSGGFRIERSHGQRGVHECFSAGLFFFRNTEDCFDFSSLRDLV